MELAMKKSSNRMSFVAVFYFVYYASFAGFWGMINEYLQTRGMSGIQIGVINAVAAMLSVGVTPFWGIVADKFHNIRLPLGISMIGTIVILLLFQRQETAVGFLIMFCLLDAIRCGTEPLIITQSMNYAQSVNGNFGMARGIASIGYIFGTYLSNMVWSKGIVNAIFIIYIILLGFDLILLPFFPQPVTQIAPVNSKGIEKLDIKGVIQNKPYLFLSLIAIMTTSMMSCSTTYVANHFSYTLGCDRKMISIYSLVSAGPEFIFLSIILLLVKKYGYKHMYMLCIAMQAVRCLVYATTDQPYVFLAASVLQIFSTGCHAVMNMQFIRRVNDPGIAATAVTVYNAMYNLSKAVYSYLFGIIYEKYSSYVIFGITGVITLLAWMLVLNSSLLNVQEQERDAIFSK